MRASLIGRPLTRRRRVGSIGAERAEGVPWVAAVIALTLTALLRWPFLDAPLTSDEGGYGEIARVWAHGRALYGSVWVDRPQGLIVIFRTAIAAGLGSPVALRCLTIGAAGLVVLGAACVGSFLGGRDVGWAAGMLVATAGASPFLEGFTLSGELLASVLATASIAALLYYERTANPLVLLAAGVAAGAAMMVKQSAFDAVIAITAYLVISRRRRVAPVAMFATAAAFPVVLALLAASSARGWLDAVVFYGSHASFAASSLQGRLSAFVSSLAPAALALAPVGVLAALGWRRSPPLARIWLAAAAAGVCVGGSFHPHYYIQLVAPLAVMAAFGAVSRGPGFGRARLVVAAAALSVAPAVPLWTASDTQQARAIWPHDAHLQTDGAVAAYVRQHSTPSQPVYVMWAAADIYYLADRAPSYRYLWMRNLATIRNAVAGADRMLLQRRPALVVEAQQPAVADPSGRTAAILSHDYRQVAVVDGVQILRPRRGKRA